MKNKKFRLKINFKSLQPLILITLIITMIGLSFGKMLGSFLVPADQTLPTVGAPIETASTNEEGKSSNTEKNATEVLEDITTQNKIYVMQLGVYETYDNVLKLAGEIQQLGYNYGISKVDGKYSVFSHISGTKESLTSVESAMKDKNIECYIKEIEVPTDDLKWSYFLQATKQKPFEIASDFIQTFTDDEMHIWGYYVSLSTSSFEAFSSERQKMLLEIYQWLNG